MFNLYCVGGEDDIEATVKSLIDAGTCDGVGTNSKARREHQGGRDCLGPPHQDRANCLQVEGLQTRVKLRSGGQGYQKWSRKGCEGPLCQLCVDAEEGSLAVRGQATEESKQDLQVPVRLRWKHHCGQDGWGEIEIDEQQRGCWCERDEPWSEGGDALEPWEDADSGGAPATPRPCQLGGSFSNLSRKPDRQSKSFELLIAHIIFLIFTGFAATYRRGQKQKIPKHI